jgi:hypothetical protein
VRAALARVGSPTGTRLPVSANPTGAHADVAVSAGITLIASFANPSMTANGVPVSLAARTDAAASSGGGTGTVTTPRQATPTSPTPIAPPVPTVSLVGKPKLSRSGSSRILTFVVNSSAAGFLVARLSSGHAKLAAHTAAKATSTTRTLSLQAGANKLRFKLSRRVKKGLYSLTLTPQASNFVGGTAISAGKVSVPKPKAAKRKRRARYYV